MKQLRTWLVREQQHFDRQDREGTALGLLVLVLLVVIDLCYRGHGNLSATFVMAPVAAAALARPAMVGLVGFCAFATAIGAASYDGGLQASVVKVAVVGVATVVGIVTARHRLTLQTRAVRLRAIADAAESALLRPLPGRVGPAALSGWHVAATEEARVGGDFYEAVPYGARARWVIGDARGHGVEAIRLGAAVVGAFREAASRLATLSEVAERVEESLSGFLGEEDFVTAMFGELGQDGSLTLINCGHPQPVTLSGPDVSLLDVVPTTPLGLEPHLSAHAFVLVPGDTLCFHTDGLDDVRPSRHHGADSVSLARGLGERSAEEAAGAIRERLSSTVRSTRLEDDVSVLVVKYTPLADVPRLRLRAVGPDGAVMEAPSGRGDSNPRPPAPKAQQLRGV